MINITKEEYSILKQTGINSNEASIFINPKDRSKIIKIIKHIKSDEEFFKIKIDTIKLLLEYNKILGHLKISLPEEAVLIDGIMSGYQSPKIDGTVLEDILDDPSIPIKTKLGYFKQIGSILREMDKIRNTTILKNFFYVDIHSGNFIVNNSGIVYGIDSDSFSILNNVPTSGYYAGELFDIYPDTTKYHFCDMYCDMSSDIVPDKNLDLYGYIRMILDFMYGDTLEDLTPDKLFKYLDFLEHYGANLELLYALESIYDDNRENINPDYLLDHIEDIYEYGNIYYDKTRKLSRLFK